MQIERKDLVLWLMIALLDSKNTTAPLANNGDVCRSSFQGTISMWAERPMANPKKQILSQKIARQVSNEKKTDCLVYVGDCTTQLCGDSDTPCYIEIPIKQPGFHGK